MEVRYNIYYAGTVLEGHDIASVRQQLGRLFKADDVTLDKLFSGQPQMIKRDCDKTTALKYQEAMKKAGAKPLIRTADAPSPIEEQASSAASATPPPAAAMSAAERIAAVASGSTEPTIPDPGFDLAPAGSDVLRPEEKPVVTAVEIDTSMLDLAETGARLSTEPAAAPAAPDTSHLSMGEVGEEIPKLDRGEIPPPPDTESIELAPEGSDFSDCAPDEPPELNLDLSTIALADEGADMLPEEYRKKETPAPPPTDHLSLE